MNKWKEKHCRLTWPGYSLWERVTSWIDSRMLIVNSTGPAALSGGGQGRLLFAICTSIVSLTANLAHCGIYFKPRRSTGLLLLHYFGHREAHFFFIPFIIHTAKPLSLKAAARTFVIRNYL